MPEPHARYFCVAAGPFLRKGKAGRPSLFIRFGMAWSAQAKRTAWGAGTLVFFTVTVSGPEIVASAGTNFPSAPATSKD